ncbi:MAG: hypothetical protein IPO22_12325 [Anaerolineales bacterium]|nr:hypothetical protein [Anaerolineales bacterium]
MSNIDKRGKLQEEPFTFRETKDGRVLIYWHGKQVTVLKGKFASKFLKDISSADSIQAQLVMARVTGHFKHGNENKNTGL